MLRRPAVLAAGGYDEAAEPAEDYELWLRMETESPGCMANMGEVRYFYYTCSFFGLVLLLYINVSFTLFRPAGVLVRCSLDFVAVERVTCAETCGVFFVGKGKEGGGGGDST